MLKNVDASNELGDEFNLRTAGEFVYLVSLAGHFPSIELNFSASGDGSGLSLAGRGTDARLTRRCL